jgi:hypothetical protein
MAEDFTSEFNQLSEAIQYVAPDLNFTDNPPQVDTGGDSGGENVTVVTVLIVELTGVGVQGGGTIEGVVSAIENQAFSLEVVDPVILEYQAAFGRIPDQAGAAYWVGQLVANSQLTPGISDELSTAFANSPEFSTRYDGANAESIGTAVLVTEFYENVLGRAPDQAGLAFWVGQDLNAAQLLQAFSQSPEFINDMTGPILAFQNLEADGTPPPPTESMFALGTTGANVDEFSLTPVTVAGSVSSDSVIDLFDIGPDGGVVTAGAGGAGFDAGAGTSIGSEIVNLTPSAGLGTIIVSTADVFTTAGTPGQIEGSFAVVSGWTAGTNVPPAEGFVEVGLGGDTSPSADSLEMAGVIRVIGNTAGSTVLTPTSDGASYTVSGGVIALASGSPTPTADQELRDAQTIVDSVADSGGFGTIAMVEVTVSSPVGPMPATFVIESQGPTPSAADIFVELLDVSGFMDFGVLPASTSTTPVFGALSSVLLSINEPASLLLANLSASNGGSATADATYNDAGLSVDTLENSGAGFTNTYLNLNNLAALEVGTMGGGSVVVTQVGPDPVLDLDVTSATALASLTYGNAAVANDDPALSIQTAGGASLDIGNLIDATNTGATILIGGDGTVTIGGFSGMALTNVDATGLGAELTLTANQPDLNMELSASAISPVVLTATDPDLNVEVSPSGNAIFASGANDAISILGGVSGNVDVWLGADASVDLGYLPVGEVTVAGAVTVDLHLLGATVGSSLTNQTTINGVTTGDTVVLHFNDTLPTGGSTGITEAWAAGGSEANSQVNVSSATTLAGALNIAASQALAQDADSSGGHTFVVNQNTEAAVLELNADTGLLDWFAYGGNTYIVEAVNATNAAATHPGVQPGDIVVELAGQATLPSAVTVHLGVGG